MFAYLRTLKNFLRDPKNFHDLKDFARAAAIILTATAIITLILRRWVA
ncbi:MAG: hypothetical protein SR2Q5_05195 [Quinella sp. 2Q5]|nr:hypothetical protein [Quinella sp. 2Q5]